MSSQSPKKKKVTNKVLEEREPSLRIGDVVKLNSGGPNMLVVDFSDTSPDIIVAWKCRQTKRIKEFSINKACVHRVRNLW